jgi:hypothetical protein
MRKISIIMLAVLISAFSFSAEAKTKKSSIPPYRPSGVIPGTDLKYEKLFIADDGAVTIRITNPTTRGVSFTSNFSFYNGKGEYLTGFVISGFAHAGRTAAYSLALDDNKAYKKATLMKVLGRSGRTGKTPTDEDEDKDEEDDVE